MEYGTCEQPKGGASFERSFISLACKFTALSKKSHSLLDDPRMTPNFVCVVSVLLSDCCHIGSGMSYLCMFVEDNVSLLGSMNDKRV